jgi:UDP-N-acetylglucosamine 2-epimerase (non-hydrolysing)
MHVVGTRPNFMKVAPLMKALGALGGIDQRLVHTGQHYDQALSDAFFADLEMPYPDHFLGVGSGTHGEQTARVIAGLEPILIEERPDAIVVPGDVNSTMAAAVTAVKLQIPIVHLESGLRSRDRTMPEEHNRIVADHLSDLLLTPSRDGDENLLAEGIPAERIAFVGNTMIDSLRTHEGRARELEVARSELGVDDYVLVTLHRPAVVDDQDELLRVMRSLEEIAAERPLLFPVHPRTAANLERAGWSANGVRLLPPQGYLRFLSLQAAAFAVLTDSGGVQEETTALGVPCFTLRANTERPITIHEGTNTLLGVGPEALAEFRDALRSLQPGAPSAPEGWDGHAAERAAAAIVDRLG